MSVSSDEIYNEVESAVFKIKLEINCLNSLKRSNFFLESSKKYFLSNVHKHSLAILFYYIISYAITLKFRSKLLPTLVRTKCTQRAEQLR
jgi:hypothetical protein